MECERALATAASANVVTRPGDLPACTGQTRRPSVPLDYQHRSFHRLPLNAKMKDIQRFLLGEASGFLHRAGATTPHCGRGSPGCSVAVERLRIPDVSTQLIRGKPVAHGGRAETHGAKVEPQVDLVSHEGTMGQSPGPPAFMYVHSRVTDPIAVRPAREIGDLRVTHIVLMDKIALLPRKATLFHR